MLERPTPFGKKINLGGVDASPFTIMYVDIISPTRLIAYGLLPPFKKKKINSGFLCSMFDRSSYLKKL
mgnify:CR=1 FL=1